MMPEGLTGHAALLTAASTAAAFALRAWYQTRARRRREGERLNGVRIHGFEAEAEIAAKFRDEVRADNRRLREELEDVKAELAACEHRTAELSARVTEQAVRIASLEAGTGIHYREQP